MSHTPTPWEVNTLAGRPNREVFAGNILICDCGVADRELVSFDEVEGNIAIIVEAVNSHERLMAENAALREVLERMCTVRVSSNLQDWYDAETQARTVLAKTEVIKFDLGDFK